MSKESKGRDRWRQLGQTRYTDVCPGCGFYFTVNHTHRADCTKLAANPDEAAPL